VAVVSPSPSWSPTLSPAPIPVVKPGQKPPPFSELEAMFAYDTSEPFAMKLQPSESARTEYGKRFRLLLYQSGGELAGGYLVLPEGQGPLPGGRLRERLDDAGHVLESGCGADGQERLRRAAAGRA
jgi:hypothetical protein